MVLPVVGLDRRSGVFRFEIIHIEAMRERFQRAPVAADCVHVRLRLRSMRPAGQHQHVSEYIALGERSRGGRHAGDRAAALLKEDRRQTRRMRREAIDDRGDQVGRADR